MHIHVNIYVPHVCIRTSADTKVKTNNSNYIHNCIFHSGMQGLLRKNAMLNEKYGDNMGNKLLLINKGTAW